METIRDHLYRIRRQIFEDPLNKGLYVDLLLRYMKWQLIGKRGTKKWMISFDNNTRSYVYPYPDHNAGELNIWTKNVDWHDTELVRSVLRPGDMIVDAGCNIGNRTWPLADIIGGALMIDAGADAIERTKENMLLNGLCAEKYYIVQKAVGAAPGKIMFTDLGGASTLNHVVSPDDPTPEENVTEIDMTTIDDEVDRIDIKPSYIKIDVEGHDLAALQGSMKTLRSGSVRLVKFERNPSQPLAPVKELFKELGWHLFAFPKGMIDPSEQAIEENVNLFASPPKVFKRLQGHDRGGTAGLAKGDA